MTNQPPTTNRSPTTNHQPTSPLTPLTLVRKKRAASSKKKSEASWGYENDVNASTWSYSAFSESGAVILAKTMKKLGCTIVEKPKQREDGLWMFEFTNPLLLMDRSKT